jgi:glycosyltransferase involved in cell wall biosynthesis
MHIPRVSVLMAVHNAERFVAAAIESVLRQTFADFELLVVDDASTDHSRAIVASYADPRVRVTSLRFRSSSVPAVTPISWSGGARRRAVQSSPGLMPQWR